MNSYYAQIITKNLSNNYYHGGACDTENNICHTNKANFNYEGNKKNNFVEHGDTTDKNGIKDLENLGNETILFDNENGNRLTDINKNNNYDNENLVDGSKVKENNLNNQKIILLYRMQNALCM